MKEISVSEMFRQMGFAFQGQAEVETLRARAGEDALVLNHAAIRCLLAIELTYIRAVEPERPWCCVTWGRLVPQPMRGRPKSFVNHGRGLS